MKKLIIPFLFILSFTAQAKLLHILHTNDLHSYFEGEDDHKGGYARIRAKIQELKKEDQLKNIPTLILDGGDFSDGTSYYLVNGGANSLRALELFQTDVTVVGNHDFLMGGKNLADQIRRAAVTTKVVSANLAPTPDMGLSTYVKPYADVEKGGLKIRVIGLTTAEPVFQYSMAPGHVNEPMVVGNLQAAQARAAGKDLIIALTHIGTYYDKLLVKSSTDIDLVVGGHDHIDLRSAIMAKNRNNKIVPIVQAGSHSFYLGSLLVDVKEGHGVDVIEQKIIDIAAPMVEDSQMANFVSQSALERNTLFGGRFDEAIGSSEIRLGGPCWGQHMAKLSAEATASDVGIHIPVFSGMAIEPGVLTYGNIVDNFPHISNQGDPGWRMGTAKVTGKALKLIIQALVTLEKQTDISFYGVKYNKLGPVLLNFRVNGRLVSNSKIYSLAMPAEIGNAVRLTLPLKIQAMLPKFSPTDKFYWPEMERHVRANSPIRCL